MLNTFFFVKGLHNTLRVFRSLYHQVLVLGFGGTQVRSFGPLVGRIIHLLEASDRMFALCNGCMGLKKIADTMSLAA